jgi:putative transcriptional regulator
LIHQDLYLQYLKPRTVGDAGAIPLPIVFVVLAWEFRKYLWSLDDLTHCLQIEAMASTHLTDLFLTALLCGIWPQPACGEDKSGLVLSDLVRLAGAHARPMVLRPIAMLAMKNQLRVLRAKHDLTQAELAGEPGVSRQTVNAIETGKHVPSLPLAFKIARVFGQRIEEMCSDEQSSRK